MQIRIHTAKNGFIVYPLVDEGPSLSSAPVDYTMNNDEVMVFETFASLVGDLEKRFNPVIIVPDIEKPLKINPVDMVRPDRRRDKE